ncbi:MAG: type I-B CRISPR-associated protein Cas8b1/Cst1 [Spirochaetes bacterium]|nr:type I-B CRISPR-associated protein Cas8b1/Cst1 [Spirochaetota bacterium]
MCLNKNEYAIYPSNWLMRAGIVGFLRIFKNNGNNTNLINNDGNLELGNNEIEMFFERYASFLSEENLYGTIKEFYNNSFLAQVWQKDMKSTLREVALVLENNNNNDNDIKTYVGYASDKKINNQETLLTKLNKILKKLKKDELSHNKFLKYQEISDANCIFESINNSQENMIIINGIADKKGKITDQEKAKLDQMQFNTNDKTKSFFDLINDLNNILNKNDTLKEYLKNIIQNYFSESSKIDDEKLICTFCNERKAIKRNKEYIILDEVHFTPLGASPSNLANFFWEGKPNLFMCLPCELIIYCVAFGFTKFNGKYYFIDAPVDIQEIKEINDIWKDWLNSNSSEATLKNSFIEILKKTEKMKAKWSLQNISIIEINPVSPNTSNIYNLSISPEIAYAIRKRIQSYPYSLKKIYDIFIENLYSQKPLYDLVGHLLYGYLSKDKLKNIDQTKLEKSSIGRLILNGNKLSNMKDVLFFLKFQKEVEDYGK